MKTNTPQFAELVRDLNEHFKFLGELGAISCNAQASSAVSPNNNTIASNNKGENQPFERAKITRPNALKPAIEPPVRKVQTTNRAKILEKTRLHIRNQNAQSPTLRHANIEMSASAPEEKEMKKKPTTEVLPNMLPESNESLETIWKEIGSDCTRCGLCEKRIQVVNSVGNPKAELMFIGEAPGADEDEKGEPFVGRAGQLLTKIIEAIDFSRDEVFIGNINRCRPPGNRQPQADEATICKPFLMREIAVVRPKVIVVLGNTACQNLLETKIGITKLRGSFKDYFGVKVMPTFHPAYLLRDPRKKREVWEDLKTVRAYLEENPK
ncbi:MAG: uracil-DNA glycosylase family protein [Pyrinomonadaceae bacterium]